MASGDVFRALLKERDQRAVIAWIGGLTDDQEEAIEREIDRTGSVRAALRAALRATLEEK